MVINIEKDGRLLAIIVPANFREEGVSFFTPNDLSQQLAYMRHPAGKCLEAHFHNVVNRTVRRTQEVLIIKSGRLRVDFYDEDQDYIESRELEGGDVILLIRGGHGFTVMEEVEMIEVKQGPFIGEDDKTRFKSIDESRVRIVGCETT